MQHIFFFFPESISNAVSGPDFYCDFNLDQKNRRERRTIFPTPLYQRMSHTVPHFGLQSLNRKGESLEKKISRRRVEKRMESFMHRQCKICFSQPIPSITKTIHDPFFIHLFITKLGYWKFQFLSSSLFFNLSLTWWRMCLSLGKNV